MTVKGGSLRRTVEDVGWARLALVSEFPGIIVPPVGPGVATGDTAAVEEWISRTLAHKELSTATVLKALVLASPAEFAAARAVTKLHGAFKVQFLCAQRGGGRVAERAVEVCPDPAVGYRTGGRAARPRADDGGDAGGGAYGCAVLSRRGYFSDESRRRRGRPRG